MAPSKIIPPSIFFTQIAPQLKSKEDVKRYLEMFSDYYDFLTEFQFTFNYNIGSRINTEQFRMLADERLNVDLYIQELKEMLLERSE